MFWFPTWSDTNQAEISDLESRGIVLSKALISCVFAFAFAERWFSHYAAHFTMAARFHYETSKINLTKLLIDFKSSNRAATLIIAKDYLP